MVQASLLIGVALAVVAWLLARRDAQHRAIAWLFSAFALGEWVEHATAEGCAGVPRPLHGGREALMHLGHFCMFARETLLVVVVLWYFRGGRGMWLAAFAGAIAWIVTLDYPKMSGPTLQLYYALALCTSQGVAWICGLSGEIPRMLTAESPMTVAKASLLLWCLATLLPITNLVLLTSWTYVQIENMACSATVIVIHLVELVRGDRHERI